MNYHTLSFFLSNGSRHYIYKTILITTMRRAVGMKVELKSEEMIKTVFAEITDAKNHSSFKEKYLG